MSIPLPLSRRRRTRPPHLRALVALLAAVAVLATACGSGDDPEETAPIETEDPADEPLGTESPVVDDAGTGSADRPVGSDPLFDEQWGLVATNVPQAWAVTGGAGVTIAIVDSGVDLDHPDLVDRLVPGWDFVDGDDQPDDPNGHGTHVAGIAAASSNDIGIAGAAPNASIMPIRVLDDEGAGSSDVIAEAVLWAADNGADVINLSLGESGFISRFTKGGALNRAIRDVSADGVIVIAASGNEGSAGQQYRIGVDVLVVNATGPGGELTSFSNVGDVRAISAPGAAIVSTAPPEPTDIWPDGTDGYAPLDGTSMATPLVSGIAALALAAGVPADEVVDQLMVTATNPDDDPLLGGGIVDAAGAVGLAVEAVDEEVSAPATTVPPTTEPPPTTTMPPTTEAPPTTAPPTTVPAETAPPTTSIPAGQLVDEILSGIDELDAALPATCVVDGNVLVVGFATSFDDLGIEVDYDASLTGDLRIRGFSGAGTYPAAGSVVIDADSIEPVTVPIAGQAMVDDAGSGSLTVSIEGYSIALPWVC